MKFKVLILGALFMLTSAQTFAMPFADISNVNAPQLVAMDDDEESIEDFEDIEDVEDIGEIEDDED